MHSQKKEKGPQKLKRQDGEKWMSGIFQII